MKIKKYNFKKFTNISGELLPVTFDKNFPIKVKRIFFIYGKKKFTRGDHAHKKCHQFFYPLFGSFQITLFKKKYKKTFNIDYKKNTGLSVPPLTWCKVKFKNKNSILMVFCNRKYEFNDYIENFDDFLNYQTKKK